VVDYEIPMPRHTIDGRSSMRSIADALEALRGAHRLSEDSLAQIRTEPIRLPTGEVTYIILVISPPHDREPALGVALPSSDFFTGRSVAGASEKFEISRLDRAWVDKDGTVALSDGACLHAVNVVPTVICRELTEIQKRIVYLTIKFIGVEAECYRGEPSPDLAFLDYGAVYGLNFPSLKAIARYIAEQDPTLNVSRQTIANALSACGTRRPRSGRLAA
jgi:hypothetical protein